MRRTRAHITRDDVPNMCVARYTRGIMLYIEVEASAAARISARENNTIARELYIGEIELYIIFNKKIVSSN